MKYREYKCGLCGWVHAAIPYEVAQASVESANASAALRGAPERASMEAYFRCYRCGASTECFVPAKPDDAPAGSTIQAVVLPDVPRQQTS